VDSTLAYLSFICLRISVIRTTWNASTITLISLYIEGESLWDKLAHEGKLPIGEAVRIMRHVVDALGHAHKHGVVHRDIKPDYALLSERRRTSVSRRP
jgi:serine/threonine-protein kinase